MANLTPLETLALVDALRKSLIYQTPIVTVDTKTGDPKFATVKFPVEHYNLVIQLISAAGGWTLPVRQRIRECVKRDALAKQSLDAGAGGAYDLTEWEFGDLLSAEKELAEVPDVPELAEFRHALNTELDRRREAVR